METEFPKKDQPSTQQGFVVLTTTAIFLAIAIITTLMVAHLSQSEQKIAGTDVRSKEVYSAAIGGLEYGINWFEQNYEDLAWSDADGNGLSCAADTASPDGFGPTQLNADIYAHQITYTLKNCLDAQPVVMTVASQATAGNDSHIQKTVAVDVMLGVINDLFPPSVAGDDPSVFKGPPVMVEGCMSGVKGNPDIYPHEELGIAIGTTEGTVDCIDEGHFDLHGGTKKAMAPSQSLAQAIFGIAITGYSDAEDKYHKEEVAVKAKLLQQEALHPQQVLVVDDAYPRFPGDQPGRNGNNWHNSVGSADKPVILYFDREVGCPKINGGPVIHGLVYFADNSCGTHGWGASQIHGTVALRGSMTSHTANTRIYGQSLDFGSSEEDGSGRRLGPPGVGEDYKIAEIPGSWRDFDPEN